MKGPLASICSLFVVAACGSELPGSEGETGTTSSASTTSSDAGPGSTTTQSGGSTGSGTQTTAATQGPESDTSQSSTTEGSGTSGSDTGCASPPDDLPSGALTRWDDNPLLRNGPEDYDFWKTGPRVVRKEGENDYRIWYEAVGVDETAVGYATSEDGLAWTKVGVVLTASAQWEGDEVSPNSMLLEDGEYRLWYHGGGNTLVNRRIGLATSPDGLDWIKLDDPVLDLGPAGDFDDEQAAEPRVFALEDGYRMYYTGRNEATSRTSLGMATSDDGVTWEKYAGNPIIDVDAWGNFWGGAFFFENGVWHLWHGVENGGASGLAYMWSTDGIEWNDGPDNPVLTQNPDVGAADYGLVGDSVSGYRDGDTYRIMYTGFNWELFGSEGRFEGICIAFVDASC